VCAEGSFPKWHVDDLDDGFGDGSDICVQRHREDKALLDLIIKSLICSGVVFGSLSLVVWAAGVLEVISSCGESARNDNGCLDPQQASSLA
jgi:hypothetical protein